MKRTILIASPILAVFLLFIFGPMMIRFCYATLTPPTEVTKKIEEYRMLDGKESTLSGDSLRRSQMRRAQIYYWLLTRDKDIDGGDEERTLFSPWRDLIRYWRDYAGNN